jgi:hypothetical protein
MSATTERYVKVAHATLNDAVLGADDALLGSWVRLLIVADAMYPAAPPVPRAISDASLAALIEAERIQRLPGDFYRVTELDQDREARTGRAQAGGRGRADSADRGPGGRFAPSRTSDPLDTDQRPAGTSTSDPLDVSPAASPAAVQPPDQTRPNQRKTPQPPTVNGTNAPDPTELHPTPGRTPRKRTDRAATAVTLPEPERPAKVEPEDRDALDVYHELTMWRPWGIWSGDKLKAAIRDYGNLTVEAAIRAEYVVSIDRDSLLDRSLARLARDADRARQAVESQPRTTYQDAERKRIAALPADQPAHLPMPAFMDKSAEIKAAQSAARKATHAARLADRAKTPPSSRAVVATLADVKARFASTTA